MQRKKERKELNVCLVWKGPLLNTHRALTPSSQIPYSSTYYFSLYFESLLFYSQQLLFHPAKKAPTKSIAHQPAKHQTAEIQREDQKKNQVFPSGVGGDQFWAGPHTSAKTANTFKNGRLPVEVMVAFLWVWWYYTWPLTGMQLGEVYGKSYKVEILTLKHVIN